MGMTRDLLFLEALHEAEKAVRELAAKHANPNAAYLVANQLYRFYRGGDVLPEFAEAVEQLGAKRAADIFGG
jgi:hypothetical protein